MNGNNSTRGFDDFSDTGAEQAANAAAQAFEIAGARIEQTLTRAAKTGELSFSDMAESILRDLAKLAVTNLITDPLQGAVSAGVQSVFGGAQGSPLSGAGSPMSITLNVSGVSDAAGFNKSQGQISAALARAVSDGQRFF